MHINKISTAVQNRENDTKSTNFKGVGESAIGVVNKFFQVCDDVPMIGVSFTDGTSAIAPRTLVDLKEAGVPAAAETLRRESSGLVVNCLIPGAFVYGAAKLANGACMKEFPTINGKAVNLSGSWANEEAIKNLVGIWINQSGLKQDILTLGDKERESAIAALNNGAKYTGKNFIKEALNKVEGLKGVNHYEKFSDHKKLIDKATEILNPYINGNQPEGFFKQIKYNHRKNKAVQEAYNILVNGTHIYKNNLGKKAVEVIEDNGILACENLKFDGKTIGSNLKNFLRDTVDIGNALASSKTARMNPNKFIKKATGLVNKKSLMGLSVVLPIAMSMQYINRAITRKKYNKKGAPIYKDFENETRVLTENEKKKLKLEKPLAVASIVGLAALSMGKSFPKSFKDFTKMLQFNTKFPSINQCRLIATATFASRMMASEDPNELRESTVRDLATFSGLYFLGDYAEKLAAEGIQKFATPAKEGKLQMFNRTVDPQNYKTVFEKLKGWVKDKSIKSFDEIPKEYKGYRSLAKVGGLGFSIAFLGVLLPMYNKYITNKKEEKRKVILERQKLQNISFDPKKVFPKENLEITKINTVKNTPLFNSMKDFKEKSEFSKIASKSIH